MVEFSSKPNQSQRDDYASLGFTLGYKYIYNDKITIDAFFGGGKFYEQIENSGDMQNL